MSANLHSCAAASCRLLLIGALAGAGLERQAAAQTPLPPVTAPAANTIVAQLWQATAIPTTVNPASSVALTAAQVGPADDLSELYRDDYQEGPGVEYLPGMLEPAEDDPTPRENRL